jgi:stage II sporulation protein D
VPYLTAKADPYDGYSGNSVHDWTETLTADRIERAYPAVGTLRRLQVVRRDGNGEWNGRVWTLVLDGTNADVTVSGDSFRSQFGLRSTWFAGEATAIMLKYASIGGSTSPLGRVVSREYAVPGGAVQRFTHGRIYSSRGTGAHELYGALLTAYRKGGGVTSALGFPTSGIRAVPGGQRVTFEHGTLTWSRATDRVTTTPR